jgi:hypothetical protein
MFERMYSTIGSLFRATAQAAAERSAAASDSSKACSTLRSGRPSISRMRPEKTLILPFFSTVSRPALMAYSGMARFDDLLTVCACDYFAYPGNTTPTYPKAALLKQALAACQALPEPDEDEATTLHEQRAMAVAHALRSGTYHEL